uniref:AT-rich interaction domain 5A n=1 Tax=Amazona collaria TaxID=241587 RepID=A0A8B9J007_9PSIT
MRFFPLDFSLSNVVFPSFKLNESLKIVPWKFHVCHKPKKDEFQGKKKTPHNKRTLGAEQLLCPKIATSFLTPENVEQTNEEPTSSGEKEKEEEEAFLISLYKFMKDRHTPIERIPHLGFKQINLWKIYKAVEKLGAYELVTGRRLWKNVYDELGGSPGSTSAATCTRRHYER